MHPQIQIQTQPIAPPVPRDPRAAREVDNEAVQVRPARTGDGRDHSPGAGQTFLLERDQRFAGKVRREKRGRRGAGRERGGRRLWVGWVAAGGGERCGLLGF